jgi:hypothetical protein
MGSQPKMLKIPLDSADIECIIKTSPSQARWSTDRLSYHLT